VEVAKMHKWSFVFGLIPIIILAIIFALPLKTVPVQETETYWDIEMQSEPYTDTESYTETEPYTTTETYTKTVYSPYYRPYPCSWPGTVTPDDYPYYPYNQYYPYYPYNFSCSGDDIWSCRMSWPGNCASWTTPRLVTDTREVVKYRTVTKYRDVVKYRQVPVKVMKERTVTRQVRMSIWEYLFR